MGTFAIIAGFLIGVGAFLFMVIKSNPNFYFGVAGVGCLVIICLFAYMIGFRFLAELFVDIAGSDDDMYHRLMILYICLGIAPFVMLWRYGHSDEPQQMEDEIYDIVSKQVGEEERALTMEELEQYFNRAKLTDPDTIRSHINATKYRYPDGRPGHRGAVTFENIEFNPDDFTHVNIAKGHFNGKRTRELLPIVRREYKIRKRNEKHPFLDKSDEKQKERAKARERRRQNSFFFWWL